MNAWQNIIQTRLLTTSIGFMAGISKEEDCVRGSPDFFWTKSLPPLTKVNMLTATGASGAVNSSAAVQT